MKKTVLKIVRVLGVLLVLSPVAAIGGNFFYPFDPAFKNTPYFERKIHLRGAWPFFIPYLLYEPYDYDPEKAYPLVMILHGAKKRSMATSVLTDGFIQEDHPSFVLMPIAPFKEVWDLPNARPFRNPKKKFMETGMAILASVQKDYAIDENRIYLTGASVGGFGVFGTLIAYPDVFAGGLVASGGWIKRDAEKIPGCALMGVSLQG